MNNKNSKIIDSWNLTKSTKVWRRWKEKDHFLMAIGAQKLWSKVESGPKKRDKLKF